MRSLSAAIVLPLVLLGQLSQADTEVIISTEVSCTTESVNLFINPSFETGSISPWNRLTGPISVISDNSDDGQYVAQLTWVAGPNYAVSQTVTGLQVGTTYTFSFDYRALSTAPQAVRSCTFYAAHDTTAVLRSAVSAVPTWQTLSATLTATSTSHTFTMWANCNYYYNIYHTSVEFDNAKLLGPAQEICSTVTVSSTVTLTPSSTPVFTPTPSSSAVISASPSSEAIPSSSSAILSSIVVASPSVPVQTPSATPSTSPTGSVPASPIISVPV
ncbi:hypothetical protein IFM53868_02465.1, partial [Aspergillus udagawae]